MNDQLYGLTPEEVAYAINAYKQQGDAASVEAIIEANPAVSAQVLPQGTPIQIEAQQISDGQTIDSEVSNKTVNEFMQDQTEAEPTAAGMLGRRHKSFIPQTVN